MRDPGNEVVFDSKIRGEERKPSEPASVNVCVTYEPRTTSYMYVTLARSRSLTCVAFFSTFFPKECRAKERLLAVYHLASSYADF